MIESRIETKGLAPVQPHEEHGIPSDLFRLWVAANVEFGTLSTGALATGVLGLSFKAALVSVLLGNLVGGLLLALFSSFGLHARLPQMFQGEHLFGRFGNRFPAFLNFFTGASFFAVNTVIGAYALIWIFPIGIVPAVLLLSVLQIGIAFVGHDLVQSVEGYLFWFLLAVFAVLTYLSLAHTANFAVSRPATMLRFGGFSGAFILSTTAMFAFVLSWVPFSSDYSRYLPYRGATTTRRVLAFSFIGTLLSTVWMEGLGSLLGQSIALSKPTDLLLPWLPHWFLLPLLVAIVVGTISANVVNIYSAALSLLAMGVKFKQTTAALVAGSLGALVAVLSAHQFYARYEDFLFLISYWTTPWAVLMLVHYLGGDAGKAARFKPAFFAWLAGIALSIPFMNQEMYIGIFARQYPQFGDISYVVSSVATILLYRLLTSKRIDLTRISK